MWACVHVYAPLDRTINRHYRYQASLDIPDTKVDILGASNDGDTIIS